MTNWWTQQLLKLLELRAEGDEFESVALYRQPILVTTSETWDALREFARLAKADSAELTVVEGDDNYDLLADDLEFGAGRRVDVRVAKKSLPNALRFFRFRHVPSEMVRVPSEFERARVLKVADVQRDVLQFAALEIISWNDPSDSAATSEVFANPRTVVSDQTGLGIVPLCAATWLVKGNEDPALAFDFAGNVVPYRLAMCLPSAVEPLEDGLRAVARGKSKVSGPIEPVEHTVWDDRDFAVALSDAASWVYATSKEADNKQALLTAEIVRLWPGEGGWGRGLALCLSDAMESAKVAYRLHLHEKGADALKLMSELRKSLADDVKAVSAHSGALATGLWRDTAVAFGAFALKGLGTLEDWAFLVLASYLTVSWYFTSRPAVKSVEAIKNNEAVFRRRLYGSLVFDKEYDELAGRSYKESFDEFSAFRWLVTAAYVVVALAVLAYVGQRNWDAIWDTLNTWRTHIWPVADVATPSTPPPHRPPNSSPESRAQSVQELVAVVGRLGHVG